ncbi:MAG: lysophospholipid acyltransferase family protein [Pseudomonadota bacterium]
MSQSQSPPPPGPDEPSRAGAASESAAGPASRSGRRLTWTRRAAYRLGVPLASAIVRAWWRWCPTVRVIGDEHLGRALEGGAVIPVYWHQHQLHCAKYLLDQRWRGLSLGFLISPSLDGEVPAALAERAGARVIRGSSNNTGARVLRDYYVALKDGVSAAITPDGPSGPRYRFKPGAILVSQMSGRPMLPIAFCASRAWLFRTWDRFVLPAPFAKVVVAVGAPQQVPKGLDAAGLEAWQRRMEAELESLYRIAREALSS